MSFIYHLRVRLADTDAAGVIYFANMAKFFHEAYEESLISSGIDMDRFLRNSSIGFPIVHSSIDFFQPIFCGETLTISGTPTQLSDSKFEIVYIAVRDLENPLTQIAKGKTVHVAIDTQTRKRTDLPPTIVNWLKGF